ncbi:hypothetical protein [Bacillus cereus]|uniref:Uncharacterized protein n=1 Tax=Bacillus cereus VD184 TaxID=1053242 RepID=A0A9W5VS78_BACCE|nr:hypothetical protein [Bacillus cereus]EOQ10170.1 hypothetical protein IKC_05753 [Bacillus cereus VD184]
MKWSAEDGVQIRFNGVISKRIGRFDVGDESIQLWVIYSNESIRGAKTYIVASNIFCNYSASSR